MCMASYPNGGLVLVMKIVCEQSTKIWELGFLPCIVVTVYLGNVLKSLKLLRLF